MTIAFSRQVKSRLPHDITLLQLGPFAELHKIKRPHAIQSGLCMHLREGKASGRKRRGASMNHWEWQPSLLVPNSRNCLVCHSCKHQLSKGVPKVGTLCQKRTLAASSRLCFGGQVRLASSVPEALRRKKRVCNVAGGTGLPSNAKPYSATPQIFGARAPTRSCSSRSSQRLERPAFGSRQALHSGPEKFLESIRRLLT